MYKFSLLSSRKERLMKLWVVGKAIITGESMWPNAVIMTSSIDMPCIVGI
ncbi:hypothetical protein XaFJ1_GM002771 [Xanthomonas albilineans]|nr:hypothetical protein XaFJ1_GM002771 [Xanthomonas albilineans]